MYSQYLLELRYDSQLMKQITRLDEGLARAALSAIAWARYLCPNVRPAVSVMADGVALMWSWRHCTLVINIPRQFNLFDEVGDWDEVSATFIDRETGEMWRETGFFLLGLGELHPIFPPKVEEKLLSLHSLSVTDGYQTSERPQISAFQFKRLFPDLEVGDEEPAAIGLKEKVKRSLGPVIESITIGVVRYFVEEFIPKRINRRRSHA